MGVTSIRPSVRVTEFGQADGRNFVASRPLVRESLAEHAIPHDQRRSDHLLMDQPHPPGSRREIAYSARFPTTYHSKGMCVVARSRPMTSATIPSIRSGLFFFDGWVARPVKGAASIASGMSRARQRNQRRFCRRLASSINHASCRAMTERFWPAGVHLPDLRLRRQLRQ